ncbi:MAG: hypothetical protein VX733_09105 [Candidatus Latescibacterota bacterium]|nr:hypothetical protein [Candidatus Latescibacterota bacterium]
MDNLSRCELHAHIGGCLFTEDLVALFHQACGDIDWSLFTLSYAQAFGENPPDPSLLLAAADNTAALDQLRQLYIFTEADGPDFGRFMARFSLAIALIQHFRHSEGNDQTPVRRAFESQREQGIKYVELRAMYMHGCGDPEGFLDFHRQNATLATELSDSTFRVRYVPSLSRKQPLQDYRLIRGIIGTNPSLREAIVGVDLCNVEEGYPPRTTVGLFRQLEVDNEADPANTLEVLYHVGEIYFDKSVESAVRWCHQAALLGAPRLGHCTALGLDPEAAIARRTGECHAFESVAERCDQIRYDLLHSQNLQNHGVTVDEPRLRAELEELRGRHISDRVEHHYDAERLQEIRARQDYVLEELTILGTVIESCPTSNRRLGNVPTDNLHPVHRFLRSEVNLVIGADDPGIFDSPLAEEVDWVARTSELAPDQLARRLGDPYRFRLGQFGARERRIQGDPT